MSTHLPQNTSRRQFLLSGSLATMGLFLAGKANASSLLLAAKPNSKFAGVQIGAITYSYRSLPGSIEQILQYCIDSNISAIELMGDAAEDYAGKPKNPNPRPMGPPAPGAQRAPMTDEQRAKMAAYQKEVAEWRANASMDKFKEVKQMFDKAGISIYAFKPNALGPNNTDAEVEYALKAAKALGAKSVTIELPTDPAQSQRLGDLGAKHKVYIGYHLHTTATDTAWDVALAQSPYNSMNLDCGHYIAAGGNNTPASLLKLIEAKADRITSMHIKDRKNKENGGQNQVWGQGNTPLKEILTLMKEKKYKFPATIELEYDIPAGSDPVAEVNKCVAYAKAILLG
ncbi:sugar phosphate isomerase/epimerase family protein [Aquirufa rosea]|uniref:Sugar phosphate isomerase/epimerase n=1 Tax=Aquirufa rosea TaxID=2509241 RepID=A0A4Q1BY32_9BACT|nr:TIM barrel protein [Aquirufa rosea]RXK47624.1 sugar phosphate isomerase/epimerase [Aquirufa rosea]